MSTDQTEKEILTDIIVEFVQQQFFGISFKDPKELQAQNEVKILQLNQRFGADLVREVLRGMLGEGNVSKLIN